MQLGMIGLGRMGNGMTDRLREKGGHDVKTYDPKVESRTAVSLEELKTLLSAEEARATVRARLREEDVDSARRRELLNESLGHIDRQLELHEAVLASAFEKAHPEDALDAHQRCGRPAIAAGNHRVDEIPERRRQTFGIVHGCNPRHRFPF